MSDSTAKSRRVQVHISPDDSLPEVLARLRNHAGKPVQLEVPDHSPILLTAAEFRALKDAAARSQIDLTLKTTDSLRVQLATMFDLIEGYAISRRGKQVSNGAGDLLPAGSGWRTGTDHESIRDDDDPISISRRRRSTMEENRRREPAPKRQRRRAEPEEEQGSLDYLDKPEKGTSVAKLVGRVVAILLVIGLVAGVAGWYYMPEVAVTATLKEQPVSGDLIYAVGLPGATLPSDVQFTIEASRVSATVNIQASVPTTGVRTVPGDTASGSVLLRNPSDAAITIPAGTQLENVRGVAFATTDDVEVPAAGGDGPGESQVDIVAVEAGNSGNIEAGALTGKFADFDVYFSNREAATSGGTETEIHSVTDADVQALEQTLTDQLRKITADGWARQLASGESLVAQSVVPGTPDYQIQQSVGDEVDELTLTGTVEASGLVFTQSEVEQQLRQAFEQQFAGEVASGYQLLPETIDLGESQVLSEAPDAVRYKVAATGNTRAVYDQAAQDHLVEQLSGSGYGDAEALLASQSAFASYDISISPGFWPERMPQTPDRITFEILQADTTAATPTPGVSPEAEAGS